MSSTATSSATTRTPFTLAADAAYALIGAGDAAFAEARNLADRRQELPEDLAKQVEDSLKSLRTTLEDVARHLDDEVSSTAGQVVTTTGDAFSDFVERGRSIVERISSNADVRDAEEDLDNVHARIKGLATTLRNASDTVLDKLKGVGTTSTDAAASVGKAVKSAAADIVEPRTGDLDDLTRAELYELAAQRDIDGRSNMNKAQLTTALKA